MLDADHCGYGAREIWREPQGQGHGVARRTVERLMRAPEPTRAVRGRSSSCPPERVPGPMDRDFVATAPNRRALARHHGSREHTADTFPAVTSADRPLRGRYSVPAHT
ncbi:hypothetical protein [Streptomyces globisporus]|uniref:hypothetical protein n=1 Tax=Streptomyces globisporus TaxID=1908 RepID=UPI00373AE701